MCCGAGTAGGAGCGARAGRRVPRPHCGPDRRRAATAPTPRAVPHRLVRRRRRYDTTLRRRRSAIVSCEVTIAVQCYTYLRSVQ